MPEHLLNRAAVLALQAGEHHEPLLDLLESPRPRAVAALHVDRVRAYLGTQIIRFVAKRLHALGDRTKPGVEPGNGLQSLRGLGEQLGDSAALPLGSDSLGRGRGGSVQRFDVPELLPLARQLLGLLLARPRRLDLPELELEQIQLAFTRSRELAEPFDPGLELAQPGVGLAHARSELQMLGAAVRVQDVELSG